MSNQSTSLRGTLVKTGLKRLIPRCSAEVFCRHTGNLRAATHSLQERRPARAWRHPLLTVDPAGGL